MKKVSAQTLSELIVVANTKSEEEVRAIIKAWTEEEVQVKEPVKPKKTAEKPKDNGFDRDKYIATAKKLKVARKKADGTYFVPKAHRAEVYKAMGLK